MIDDKDLCFAVQTAVEKRRKNGIRTEEDVKYEDAVYDLFRSTSPRFEKPISGEGAVLDRPIDVRFRARWRISRLLNRKAGTEWRDWSVQTLIDWLIENWDTVVQVLMSLILIII